MPATAARPTAQRPKQQSKLDALAAEMYDLLRSYGPGSFVHRKLAHGLEIVLQRKHDRSWRLALARDGVPPSDNEVDICAASFIVPDGYERTDSKKPKIMPKTGRLTTYFVVELLWAEQETPHAH